MAIPGDLYRLSISGVYRYFDGVSIDAFPWALTWYCTCPFGDADPATAIQWASVWKDWCDNNAPDDALMGGLSFITRWGGTRLSDETTGQHDEDVLVGTAGGGGILPPQTSLFVLGRTAKLGHQTRKWLPNIRFDLFDTVKAKFILDPGDDPPLLNWAKASLTPKAIAGGFVTPVVWEPATETVRTITEVLVQANPRTQKGRVYATGDDWRT